jgi:hypothetical protein
MISIRKYLNMNAGGGREALDPDSKDALHSLLCGVLDAINQHVLSGDACGPQRLEVTQLREAVQRGWTEEEGAQAAHAISRILAEHHETVSRGATSLTVEMQHIFAMLNQALIVLADGHDRSVARLIKIQESLLRTSMIQDIVALKSSLADTVRFIQAESAEAHESAAQELARFETEVSRTREFLGSTRTELAGRPEGVTKIAESLKKVVPGEALYLVAFLFDRLQAVTQRYGPAVADELIFRLIKERLQPVAPSDTAYRWTPSSLVAVFRRPRDLAGLRKEVAILNGAPLVHRIALGNRTAVMTMTPSHLVAEGVSDSPAPLIEQVDRFTGILSQQP